VERQPDKLFYLGVAFAISFASASHWLFSL
jgi:hypothetical protein